MPNRTDFVLDTLNAKDLDLTWGGLKAGKELKQHPPLFPRINVKKDKVQTKNKEHFIDYSDFENLGLKTAEILVAEKVEDSDKLYKLKVKLGDEERQIVSGIADHYSSEELVGKMVVIISNLEPATIRGVESKGMLLAASRKKELSLIIVDGKKVESGKKVH